MKDGTLREILTQYERKRDKAEEELENRKKIVYDKVPQIKDIESKMSSIGLKMMRLVLSNPSNKDEITQECKIEMENLKYEKDRLLSINNFPEDFLEVQYECKLCQDRGFLKNGDKCNCLKQTIINESYKMSNLSRILKTQNLNNLNLNLFSDEVEPGSNISPKQNILEILSICESFVRNFDKDNEENLLFYGDTGLGKTFMSNGIAKSLLDKGYVVIYQTSFKMFEIIEEYKFKNSSHSISKENYENLFECDLLIIDDLGTELTNSFTISELFVILNTRLLNGKKTIISTNLSPMQLGELYSQRIFSRIFDKFTMVKFTGKDLRWENKLKR